MREKLLPPPLLTAGFVPPHHEGGGGGGALRLVAAVAASRCGDAALRDARELPAGGGVGDRVRFDLPPLGECVARRQARRRRGPLGIRAFPVPPRLGGAARRPLPDRRR